MFFAALFAAYYELRANRAQWPPPMVRLDTYEAGFGTLLLFAASAVMVLATRAMDRGRFRAARRWTVSAIVAAIGFVLVADSRLFEGRVYDRHQRVRLDLLCDDGLPLAARDRGHRHPHRALGRHAQPRAIGKPTCRRRSDDVLLALRLHRLAGYLRNDLFRAMKKHAAIATALVLAIIGSALFIAAYFTGGDRLYEGLSLALAAAGLCAAALGWAFWIVPNEQVVDEIVTYPSSPGERAAESGEAAEELRQIGAPAYARRVARRRARLVRGSADRSDSLPWPGSGSPLVSYPLAKRRSNRARGWKPRAR